MSSDTGAIVGSDRLGTLVPDRRAVLIAAIVLNTELLAVLLYVSSPLVSPTAIRYYVYPLVWINVGLWALSRTYLTERDRHRSTRRRYVATAIAVGYFLVLAYVAGVIGPGYGLIESHLPPLTESRLAWLPPGWGPALLYNGRLLSLTLMPYQIVGYVALAYLVYVTVLDAAGSAIGGVLGLLSCVSCTWPVLVSIVGGVGGAGLTATVSAQSYGLSTIVFCLTVGFLYWRPFGRRSRE